MSDGSDLSMNGSAGGIPIVRDVREVIRETQGGVKKRLEQAFADPLRKDWLGDDPKPGFGEDGVFSEENWNDGRISLFREFFASSFGDGISNEVVFIGDLEVAHEWHDDQNYVFIHNARTGDLYYATWYKSRGRTDLILHNGKTITLPAFHRLLQQMLKELAQTVE